VARLCRRTDRTAFRATASAAPAGERHLNPRPEGPACADRRARRASPPTRFAAPHGNHACLLWGHERRSARRSGVPVTVDMPAVFALLSSRPEAERPPYSTRMSRRPDAPGYEVSASLTCLSKKVGPFGAKRKCVAACKNSF
jgi:hypothetical protein